MSRRERELILAPRPDLGVRRLLPEWRSLVAVHGLRRDLVHGVVLAASTLPLALLLAVVSGAPASAGIVSAAIGSAVCVFFGGTRVALSGPGLAIAFVSSSVVAAHGFGGLGLVMLMCGALQIATGALGVGRFVRLVPVSLVRGAIFGTAALILVSQLPQALGVPLEAGAPALARLDSVFSHLPGLDPTVLAVALASGLLGALVLVRRQIPGALLAVAGGAAAVALLGLDLPTVTGGEAFPSPRMPELPSSGFVSLFGSAIELWGTMTLSTLVNTAALERISKERPDADQELIGNGLATMALAFLGGVATTQLVARSTIATRLRVESRRPALVQAAVVIALGLGAWPLMRHVPLAALTGIAVAVAVPLLDTRPIRELWQVSRIDVAITLATILPMLLGRVVLGLLLGLATSFAFAAFRLARTRAMLDPSAGTEPHHVGFTGPVTFLASMEMEHLRRDLAKLDASQGLVVDLRSVMTIDVTGALALVAALDEIRAHGGKVALLGPSMVVRERLLQADGQRRAAETAVLPGSLQGGIAANDREVDRILGKPRAIVARPQLLAGLARFREELREHYDSLFAQLADGQHPHTLFITCADSRISPGMIMGSHPGDLFIVRAIGALVAPSGSEVMPQEGAAVEYAVGVLGVQNIVVCGHSKCGAIGALKKGGLPHELTTLEVWAKHAAELTGDLAHFADADEAARAVTVRQVEHLLTYPLVREKHDKGELQIHAWFYDIGEVELFEWSEAEGRYEVLGAAAPSLPLAPSELLVESEAAPP